MRQLITVRGVFLLLFVATVVIVPVPLAAQTYYSLRTQALNTNLAGIIEDQLTDIYLNPARAGLIDRAELYAVKLRDRTINRPYPIISNIGRSPLIPRENDGANYSYSPLALNYLSPLGAALKVSVGVEVAHSDNDELYRNSDFYLYSSEILENYTSSSAYDNNLSHALLNVALAAPLGDSFAGVRLEAQYDRDDYRRIYDRNRYRMLAEQPEEIYFMQDYEITRRDFEMASFAGEAGWYNPGGRISDLALRFGWKRSLLPVNISDSFYENEDYDGNGNSLYGGYPDLIYTETTYDSNRDYREIFLLGRAHLNFAPGIRVVQTVSWSRGDGDGAALLQSIRDIREGARELFTHDLQFRYDGEHSNLSVSSVVGHGRDIHERVRVTAGVKAIVQRRTFDEDGVGAFQTLYHRDFSVDSLFLDGPYRQTHRDRELYYYLILPLAIECKLHKYVSLQLSAEMVGRYNDDEYVLGQDLALESSPALLDERFETVTYDLESTTAMYYSNGLTVNIDDMLLVDMLYGYSSSISFSSYGYLSVRYRF